ncbi:MAG: IS1182 family transposase [Actinomycetota bacterium]|nr:IS1182 family transposase [Actinomycetota bacterium]
MQGKASPERQLLDAGIFCRGLVEEGSIYAFLADHRHELFPDQEFADLFPSGRGRPSTPAALICSVMVLQALEGLSDRDALRQLRNRIDWKVACGLSLDDAGFDFTNLTYWRAKLRSSERPERIFDAVRKVVQETGVLQTKTRRALDSTILDDAVATQDTVTQLISQSRRVLGAVPALASTPLAHDYASMQKPVIDWSDKQMRDRLITELVSDATALVDAGSALDLDEDQSAALALLALVAGLDVEPGEQDGSWKIARRVAKDRVISTVDVEARHGHKSVSVRKDGFKAHLVCEPDTGIVTAAKITPAHAPDGPSGLDLVADEAPCEILADSAYGSGATRAARSAAGHGLVIKPVPTRPAVPGGLSRDELVVDHESRSVTCPAGHLVHLSKKGTARFSPHCGSCGFRSRCTKASARSFSVSMNDAELVAARAAWGDETITTAYRQHRPMAERTISWLVAKNNRRLRYRGVPRNEQWLKVRVAALNLRRLLALGLVFDRGWRLAGP